MMNDVLDRMGNSILSLIGISRNLSSDYRRLIELLSENRYFESKEPMQIRDRLTAVVRTKDGKVKLDESGKPMIRDTGWSINGLTNIGLAEIAGLLLADVTEVTAFDYIAIGTGTTAFDPTQTSLVTETHREAGTGTRVTTTVTNDTAQLVRTFSGYSGSEDITESGVFNAATGGIMLCRQTFSALPIDWDAGNALQISWRIQCKQGT